MYGEVERESEKARNQIVRLDTRSGQAAPLSDERAACPALAMLAGLMGTPGRRRAVHLVRRLTRLRVCRSCGARTGTESEGFSAKYEQGAYQMVWRALAPWNGEGELDEAGEACDEHGVHEDAGGSRLLHCDIYLSRGPLLTSKSHSL